MKRYLYILIVICVFQVIFYPYDGSRDTFKYNPYQDTFDRAQPGDVLKYNAFEDKFEYKQPDYQFKYNPYTNKFE